jgi:hypothetical protein
MMNAALIMLIFSSLSALLIGWDYFGRYTLPRPPIGVFNLWDVTLVMAGILLVPYLYLALPLWLVATLLALSTVSLLATYFQPILADKLATWALTLALGGAEAAAFLYLGADHPLHFAVNNSLQLMAAITIANLWAQSGLTGRDAAILSGALVVYDTLLTLLLPFMAALFVHLAVLPFAPLVAWPLLDGRWIAIGLGDLIMATVFPLVLRREAGQMAGIMALVLTGLALAGVLWLPALGGVAGNLPGDGGLGAIADQPLWRLALVAWTRVHRARRAETRRNSNRT